MPFKYMSAFNNLTVEDIFNDLYAKGFSPQDIDSCITFSCSGFIPNKPILTCELSNKEKFLKMASNASNVIFTPGKNEFEVMFSAVYMNTERYPLPRHYFLKHSSDLFQIGNFYQTLRRVGIAVSPCSPSDITRYIAQGDISLLAEKYLHEQQERIPPDIRKIFAGRMLFTNLSKVVFLNSDKCLCCEQTDIALITSTIIGIESICLAYFLCSQCLKKAESEGLAPLEYLKKSFGIPSFGDCAPYSFEAVRDEIIKTLSKELDCINISVREMTIYAFRKSGFKLIFRLDSPVDYAYMIMNPVGKEVSRFDSAKHHKVEGGPHHLHFDTSTEKATKVISPSYFIGCPLFDLKGFEALLRQREAEWDKPNI